MPRTSVAPYQHDCALFSHATVLANSPSLQVYNALPLNPHHDPQVYEWPHEVGKAGGAEGVAVDLAGQ